MRICLFLLVFAPGWSYANSSSASPQFGFGVSDVSKSGSPQISIAWKPSEAATFMARTGLQSGGSDDFFEVGLRFNRNLFIEENQDFFFFMGLGLASRSSQSGYKLEAGAGSEIFLAGLPNFGLHFLAGFAFNTISSTALESTVSFGLHYYF